MSRLDVCNLTGLCCLACTRFAYDVLNITHATGLWTVHWLVLYAGSAFS